MTYAFDPVFGPGNPGPSPVIPVSTTGHPYGGPYRKSVTLTPGTPVPEGRGAFVKASGRVVLKLADGGTIVVDDLTGGAGTRVDGFAVVDADITGSPGAVVQILY